MFLKWRRSSVSQNSASSKAARHTGTRPKSNRQLGRLLLEHLEDRCLPATSLTGLAAYGQLPLSFEANQGQTDAQVNFLARGNGYALFLTPGQAVLSLQKPSTAAATTSGADVSGSPLDVLHMQLAGPNASAQV